MKTVDIRILLDKKMKEDFLKACKGRSMSYVVREMIKDYIRKEKKKR